MSANAAAVVIRCKHVVGTDGDEAGVTDLHLAVKLDQTLGLALVPRAESSPANHQNHGIWPLQVRKLATFARVIGQLIIGKYRASYNVRSHKTSSSCVASIRTTRAGLCSMAIGRSGPGNLTCFSFMSRPPLLLLSALQELRGMLNKQFWVLVLRTMIAVGVQNELRVRQVLLQDERVNRIDEHVVAAVHHQRRLSDLLQVNIAIFRLSAPFLQSG